MLLAKANYAFYPMVMEAIFPFSVIDNMSTNILPPKNVG
jgi:hypothetical protein